MADVVIKINGDVKNFQNALQEAQDKTQALSAGLSTVAKTSAVAFAALTAEIGFAVHAFEQSELASDRLTQALISQGIYSKELVESYEQQADALAEVTGISDEAITSAQTTIQAYLGQQKVTQELTNAIADLSSAKKMDMDTTAEMIGKAINGQGVALKKLGIEIDDNASKSERYAQILEQVTLKYGGMAEASSKGLGVFKLIAQNFDTLQESIGSRFAPMIIALGEGINRLLIYLKDPAVVTFISNMLVFGVTASGLVATLSALGVAVLAIKALLIAAGVAFSTIAAPIAISIAAITGLSLVVTALFANWSTVLPAAHAIWSAFVKSVGDLAGGLGKIMTGAFTLDLEKIKEGWKQVTNALSNGMDEYNSVLNQKLQEQSAIEEQSEKDKIARSEQAAIDQANSKKALRDEEFQKFLEDNEEYQTMEEEQKARFREKNLEMFNEQKRNEDTIRDDIAKARLSQQLKEDTTFLENKRKYGASYAAIEQSLNTDRVNKAKDLSGQLVAMQSSENATLKGIGKAAAVANITIDTARGATSAYMRSIEVFGPLIGPAIGVALAAAVVAFGAEQIGKVTSAADGGIITGGRAGVDSVPAMLMPGELVVPAQNFEEVVSAVRGARGDPGGGSGEGGGGIAHIIMELKGDLMDLIEAKSVERGRLGISFQGAS